MTFMSSFEKHRLQCTCYEVKIYFFFHSLQTKNYNSLQLSVIIYYENLSCVKTRKLFSQRGLEKTKKRKKKVGGRSPQNEYNNKHKKVACLGFV